MKRTLIVMLVVMLALGLVALVGCGDDKESETTGERAGGLGTTTGGIGDDMSLAGTFTYTEGGNTYRIVVKGDGTFSGNGFGDHSQEKSGTYTIIDQQFGKGAVFTFSDGGQETWSILIANDEMRAICDADGNQYMKQ